MPITSGVPQGSLLAPFLFSGHINDLPSYISNSTSVGLFTDDTKLYCCIKEPCDALALQEDIQSLHCWSDENHLRFNQSKCKVLSITRKSSPLVNMYCLGNEQLLFSDSEVDLGILLSPNLTWSNQVNKVRSKGNRMLGLIRRSTMGMTDTKASKFLYIKLVRSDLAYSSQVWCPQSVKLIENIEKVQRRATKFILNLGFMTNIPYTDRLLNLDLLPITYWHEYLDLVLLYKIINNYTCVDDSARPIISRSRLTRSEIPFARTVTFQSSYFIRACKAWNILSDNLRHRDIGLHAFKSGYCTQYRLLIIVQTTMFDLFITITMKL